MSVKRRSIKLSLSTFERMIFGGELREDSSFSEKSITDKIKIQEEGLPASRTVVREGLNVLATLGFVEQTPKVGTKFTRFSLEEKEMIIGMRSDMEARAVNKLVISLGEQSKENKIIILKDVYNHIDLMREYAEKGDYVNFFKADLEFHSSICLTAKLAIAAEWIRFFYLMTFLSTHSRLLFNSDPTKMIIVEGKRIVKEHGAIYQSIVDGRKDTSGYYYAEKLIRDHVCKAEKHWVKALERATP